MTVKRGRRRKRSPSPETWEVEAIRSHWPLDANRSEKLFYNVKWKLKPGQVEDWHEDENWIPESSMNCGELLDSYWTQVRQERREGRAPLHIKPPQEIMDYIDGDACPSLYFPEIARNKPKRKNPTAKQRSSSGPKKPRRIKQNARMLTPPESFKPMGDFDRSNHAPPMVTPRPSKPRRDLDKSKHVPPMSIPKPSETRRDLDRSSHTEISTENMLFMLNHIDLPGSQMVLRKFASECWQRKYDALNTLTPIFVITFLESPAGEPQADWSMTVFENRPGCHPKHVCECVPTKELWVVAPELVAQAEDRLAKMVENLVPTANP